MEKGRFRTAGLITAALVVPGILAYAVVRYGPRVPRYLYARKERKARERDEKRARILERAHREAEVR